MNVNRHILGLLTRHDTSTAVGARRSKPNDPEFEEFLSRLRLAAARKGISAGRGFQTRLESLTGVDQSQMSRMLNRKRWPERETILRLAAGLGTSPGWLLFGEGEVFVGLDGDASLEDLVAFLRRHWKPSGGSDVPHAPERAHVSSGKTKA